jgi:hypothetical protein
MKQEANNEMDLLLRRLGRRDDAVMPEDHLDADELNAYAENVLPAAARARYTMHLAECSRCRSLVAQLSSSAGVVAATDTAAVSEVSGFRKFLASLFTPMVLRYAGPALGLIVVAVIGFVVLRRDRASEYVVQDTNVQQSPAAAPTAEKFLSDETSSKTVPPSSGLINGEIQEKTKQTQPASPPNTAPVVSSIEADVAKDKAVAQPKPEEQAAAANEPPPPKPEPTATPEPSPRAAETDVARSEVKVQSAPAAQAPRALRKAEREDKDNVARARKPADAAGTVTAGSGSNLQIDGVDDAKAGMRTVAGRRFRKHGAVWIDTAYDASKNAVTLARGSEQYRALVADEPAIKTIAEQLAGEIIVVWKGHTYRIR